MILGIWAPVYYALAMIGRLFFLIFFCLGGFLFYIPKWLLMGTKGSRQRKKILRQQDVLLRQRRV
jgi:hypothetical protein